MCEQADIGTAVDENSLLIGCWDYQASYTGGPIVMIMDCSGYAAGADWTYSTEDALKQTREWCQDEGLFFHEIDCEPEHWDDDECPPRLLPDKMVACGP
ncbi:hypothetical protein L6R53_30995 [Myxococcota bacterium]|nr:hypothetical protein [Myxococcota bacterium]